MELQLKVELTDEQYRTLMTKSIDAILDSPEAVAAMQRTISDNLGEYLKLNPDIIKGQFYEHNPYYGWEQGVNGMTRTIVKEAASKAADSVREAVTAYMLDVAKTQDMESIVHQILIQAILTGAVSGLDSWKDRVDTELLHIGAGIIDIKGRLGLENN